MTAVSRRLFLGGASVAAGSVALIGETRPVAAADEPPIVGPMPLPITLTVNGVARDDKRGAERHSGRSAARAA